MWSRERTSSRLCDSISLARSRSNGSRGFDQKLAALRRLLAVERPDGGGAGEIGREEEGEDAHRVQEVTAMLNVVLVDEGAHGAVLDCSPETS